ncbi:hypothetical protein FJU11_16620 [Pararhizobium mangrovi]|uniref:Uncharacterized protein n=1 Tax=Pararhizobium mangrovi TaxID=2590452 RepID=A0A506U2D8_9HYPH|nr:hypothetical protein [Pararhizobium mangrovi]TPW26037.1 hypothetical protein FJU11_16620 [Pararhizobium mangrovi]
MNGLRSQGMNGPDAIRPHDMRGWADLTGTIIRRAEYGILLDMDAVYRSAVGDEMAANEARRETEQG